jgi:hypothetical protein
MPSFHSIEEQEVFEPAAEAYEKYLEVLEECRRNYNKEPEEDD